jgi:hypothetical protein
MMAGKGGRTSRFCRRDRVDYPFRLTLCGFHENDNDQIIPMDVCEKLIGWSSIAVEGSYRCLASVRLCGAAEYSTVEVSSTHSPFLVAKYHERGRSCSHWKIIAGGRP